MKTGIPCPEEVEPLGSLPRVAGHREENYSKEQRFVEYKKSRSGKKNYGISRFPVSLRTATFRKRFFPEATSAEWNHWRWQLTNRISNLSQLERMIRLSDDERRALGRNGKLLPLATTPYYASLIDEDNPPGI